MWLSLARAPGLGPGRLRFESCHPDLINICASGSGVEHHLAKVGAAGSNPVSRFFNWAETLILEGFRFLFVSYYLYTAVDSYNAFFKMFHWLH